MTHTLTIEISEPVHRWLQDRLERQSPPKQIDLAAEASEACRVLEAQRKREGYRLMCESDEEYLRVVK